MGEVDQLKRCPSCRNLTAPSDCVKRISRSSGKTTTSWRCKACVERKEAAVKPFQKA